MSLIQYQRATYAVQLRDQLELAGCDAVSQPSFRERSAN